jgi:glucuronate isomerase
MLYSQGIALEDLGIGNRGNRDSRQTWRTFARHYYLFRGTPTRIWLDFTFQEKGGGRFEAHAEGERSGQSSMWERRTWFRVTPAVTTSVPLRGSPTADLPTGRFGFDQPPQAPA